jgi:cation-transporting ATPase 13A3/4/5
MFEGIEDRGLIILIFFSFVLQSLPAAGPVFIKAAYTTMLLRFRMHKIMGLNRDKTVDSSRLETICFDKTGTLTENSM